MKLTINNQKPPLKGGLWYLQESNQGHTDFQSVALPTELRYHKMNVKYRFIFIIEQNNYYKNPFVNLMLKL